jgi:hypothetical protein
MDRPCDRQLSRTTLAKRSRRGQGAGPAPSPANGRQDSLRPRSPARRSPSEPLCRGLGHCQSARSRSLAHRPDPAEPCRSGCLHPGGLRLLCHLVLGNPSLRTGWPRRHRNPRACGASNGCSRCPHHRRPCSTDRRAGASTDRGARPQPPSTERRYSRLSLRRTTLRRFGVLGSKPPSDSRRQKLG